MAQSADFVVDDGTGASLLSQLNTMLPALASSNSGGSAPAGPVPFQLWGDTGAATLRMRNNAGAAWVDVVTSDYASTIGNSLITAASTAAARTAIAAPAIPTTSSGPGQVVTISPAIGAAAVLPASGTWLYAITRYNSGVAANGAFGVDAGGTTVGAATAGQNWSGFAWRVS